MLAISEAALFWLGCGCCVYWFGGHSAWTSWPNDDGHTG